MSASTRRYQANSGRRQRALLAAAATVAIAVGASADLARAGGTGPSGGAFVWNGFGTTQYWHDNNWSPGGGFYPSGPTASATIIGGQPVIGFDLSVGTLTMQNALIRDNGHNETLTVSQRLTFNGTGAQSNQLWGNLTTNGTTNWDGGNIETLVFPTLANNGAFNINCDQTMQSVWFGPALFNNTGSITKSATSGLTTMSMEMYNSGTITANNGTLRLISNSSQAGSSSGTFTSNGGGSLQLWYQNFANGASFTGTGTTELQIGNIVSGATTVRSGARLAINGGINTINGSLNIASGATVYLTANGDIDGNGSINGPGTLVWNGGQIRGAAESGADFLTSTGPMHITGADPKSFYSGRFRNTGTMTWDDGDIYTALFPTIANAGTFDIQNDHSMFSVSFGPGTLVNTGLLKKTSGVGTSSLSVDLQNSGTIRADSGYLKFQSSTTNATSSGTFTSNAGSIVLQSQFLQNGAKFNGTGVNVLSDGNTVVSGANVSIAAGRTMIAGTGNTVNGALSINTGAVLELATGGDLLGEGQINGPGNFEWTGGQISGAPDGGTTSLVNNAPLLITGPNVKSFYRGRFTNAGHATWSDGDIQTGLFPVISNTGTFDITGNNNLFSVSFGPAVINNSGTMRKFQAPSAAPHGEIAAITSITAEFHNTGTVRSDYGQLWIDGNGAAASSSTGTFISNGDSIIRLTNHTLNSGTNFRGTGVNQLNVGNVVAGNVSVAAGRLQTIGANNVISGTLSIAAGATYELATFGQISGTGMINGLGTMEWTGGNIGSGSVPSDELTNAARLRIIGADTKFITGNLFKNTGLATWEAGDIHTEFTPVFTNAGTFDIQSDNTLASSFFGPGSFVNTGTMKKTGSTGGQTTISAMTNNTGAMLLNVGSTVFGESFSTTGTFTVAPGANVHFNSTTTLGGVQNWPTNYELDQNVPTNLLTDAGHAGAKLVLRENGNPLTIGSSQHLVGLALGASQSSVTAGGNKLISTGTLSIGSTSRLDMNDADMILSGTPKSTIESYVFNGYNFGGWDGIGIISTTALNDPNGNKMFGVMSGDEYFNNNGDDHFNGQLVHGTDTLVKYTYFGDVDFNGAVDVSDYNLIDFGFATHLTGWANGDVDYSGAVDVSDYNLIDFAFSTQNGTLRRAIAYLDGSDRSTRGMNSDPSLQEVMTHFAQFGETYASGFLATVPEPTTIGAISIGALALGRRRRRRN